VGWRTAQRAPGSSGYFINTVSRYGSEETIRRYVQQQGTGQDYQVVHTHQLELF
jgi:REP element-mobilizing transposase RayT